MGRKQVGSEGWYQLVWEQSKSATLEHFLAEIFYEGLCLKVQIVQHLVQVPAIEELNVAAVNIGT
jgi:hypothetical protein